MKGRKRHLVVDHLGLPIALEITAANLGDRDGLRLILDNDAFSLPPVIFADSGYKGKDFEAECAGRGVVLKPVPRRKIWCFESQSLKTISNFAVVAKRWIVERSFAWIGKFRRLSKDYEQLVTVSQSLVYVGFIRLLLNRLVE